MSDTDVRDLINWQNRAISVLRNIEWCKTVKDDVGHNDFQISECCPECGGYKPGSFAPKDLIGHTQQCLLKELIG